MGNKGTIGEIWKIENIGEKRINKENRENREYSENSGKREIENSEEIENLGKIGNIWIKENWENRES